MGVPFFLFLVFLFGWCLLRGGLCLCYVGVAGHEKHGKLQRHACLTACPQEVLLAPCASCETTSDSPACLCPAGQQEPPHQGPSGQEAEAEPPHPAVDPHAYQQQDQVRDADSALMRWVLVPGYLRFLSPPSFSPFAQRASAGFLEACASVTRWLRQGLQQRPFARTL